MNILDDVKRILAQPFECRKTSLPDGALHNVQKELENMINAIDKDYLLVYTKLWQISNRLLAWR